MLSLENYSNNVLPDLVRVLAVIAPASLVIGITVMVIHVYYQAYRSERYKEARTGLLPHHVWLIGLSYVLLTLDEMLVVFERKGSGWNYHQLLLIPAFAAGFAALVMVLKYEQRRYGFNKVLERDATESDDANG